MNTWQRLKSNPSLWQRYFVREVVLKAIRKYFDDLNFHEVEAPILIANPPAESYLDVFETTLLDRRRTPTRAFLSTSPEVPLKKLMVAGIGNCYCLTKSFRNTETESSVHNPEFTILEWYRVGADYRDMMTDCEKLMLHIHEAVRQQGATPQTTAGQLLYQGARVDIRAPWERLTVAQSFETYAHVSFDRFLDEKEAPRIAAEKGYTVDRHTTWEELFNQIFLNEIEPRLGRGRPTILYEFPAVMGALARKNPSDPRFAERFEFYIEGLELGDCYSELTDWREQKQRFEHELAEIQRLGKTSYEYDHDFIDALKAGLPDSSGIAIGVDRLVMLFANAKHIQDTLFFPSSEMFGR